MRMFRIWTAFREASAPLRAVKGCGKAVDLRPGGAEASPARRNRGTMAIPQSRDDREAVRSGETADAVWGAVAGRDVRPGPQDADRVTALAALISAATAAAIVPGAEALLPAGDIRQARLLNRFRRLQGEKWAAALTAAGIPNVALKGLASAHCLYPSADDRAVSDADILIRSPDLPAALDLLAGHGFAFAETPTRSPWGFVSDASFQPLIGRDGANIDLHVQGAPAPFEKAASAADILSASETTPVEGLRVPSPEHRFLIAAAHAASDLFGRDAIKSTVDGLLMLRAGGALDWPAIRRMAAAGGMMRPLNAFLALLGALGGDTGPAEAAGFRPAAVRGRVFERVVRDHRAMFEGCAEPSALTRLRREAFLAASWPVFARRNWRRLTGLLRPRKGLPAMQSEDAVARRLP